MIREVVFLSQVRAEYFRPLTREAIISITGSGQPPARLRRGWLRVLRLVFDDVEGPDFGAVPFDMSHAEEILRWLKTVQHKVDTVFVHCHAGMSRSAAVAKFIAERYDLPGGVRGYDAHNQRVYRILARRGRRNKVPPSVNRG